MSRQIRSLVPRPIQNLTNKFADNAAAEYKTVLKAKWGNQKLVEAGEIEKRERERGIIEAAESSLRRYLHAVESAKKKQVTPLFNPNFDKVISEIRGLGLKHSADLLHRLTTYQARNARMKAAQFAKS